MSAAEVQAAPRAPLPPWLQPVADRIAAAAPALGAPPAVDQATVNEYPCGTGLNPHFDSHAAFEGAILSLSLAGQAVMQFRRGGARRALLLPRRSLLVMAGESRYAWWVPTGVGVGQGGLW
jgi:alkylated DNA repair protein alkB family protein 8